MRHLICQECRGAGGYIEVILDDGSGPHIPCGFCGGTGEVTSKQRGLWLYYKKLDKKEREEYEASREQNKT